VKRDAFSLVEVTLALGVAGISLLAIFALLPVGVRTNQIAIEQAASTDILSAVAADLRATPVTAPRGSATTSPRFAIGMPANPVAAATTATLFFTAQGQFSANLKTDSRYRVIVTFLPNGPGARTATLVHLKGTWPAAASIPNAGGATEMFVALDRN
jgi:Tfp pilus assembly protein PilV